MYLEKSTVITPSEKTLPARLNMDLIHHLQTVVAPQVFTPRAVYDGRKNMFAAATLPLPNGDWGEVGRVHSPRQASAKCRYTSST